MKKTIVSKKGFSVNQIMPLAMIIGVTAIGIAFTLQILGDVKGDMTTNSAEYNATGEGIDAVAKFPEKLGIIVTVIIAVILIGLLTRYLMKQFGN